MEQGEVLMATLRRLNESGIECFRSFLKEINPCYERKPYKVPKNPPEDILNDPKFSDDIGFVIDIDDRDFKTRLDWGEYIYNKFLGIPLENLETDAGIWAWLTLYHAKRLYPSDENGRRNLGAEERWIPSQNYNEYYRHFLQAPYVIYKMFKDSPDDAIVLLGTPFGTHGEVSEQLASRQEIITNRELIKVASLLYWNDKEKKLKKGAASDNNSPGSSARFAKSFMDQIDCTWNLFSMKAEEIIKLLPKKEYKNFIS